MQKIMLALALILASCRTAPPTVVTIEPQDTLLPAVSVLMPVPDPADSSLPAPVLDSSGLIELRFYRDAYGQLLAICQKKDQKLSLPRPVINVTMSARDQRRADKQKRKQDLHAAKMALKAAQANFKNARADAKRNKGPGRWAWFITPVVVVAAAAYSLGKRSGSGPGGTGTDAGAGRDR